MVGLAWLAVRRLGRWGALEWLAFVSALSFVIAVLIGFARQTAITSTTHTLAHPQGRFLFVLIVPVAWLLLAGLREVWSRLAAQRFHPTYAQQVDIPGIQVAPSRPGVAWGVWLFCNALFVFAAYCILSLILPYFYA